jgi:hypothetical protein
MKHDTRDQEITVSSLVNHGGAVVVGGHLDMPVIQDRSGAMFAITPTGHTLSVIALGKDRETHRGILATRGHPSPPFYGHPSSTLTTNQNRRLG